MAIVTALHTDFPNLDTIKTELVRYHDSGAYDKQIALVDAQAKNYLQQRINQNKNLSHPKKLAIVFDIDETALSNYSDMAKRDFSRHGAYNDYLLAHDPAIQPTFEIYQLAEKNHVAVFFVTGRPESLRPATVKNLDAAGYTADDGLYMTNNYKNSSIIPFKSAERKLIESKGYDIVLSLGDQESDLKGGFVDKGFKLPNPYYYLA